MAVLPTSKIGFRSSSSLVREISSLKVLSVTVEGVPVLLFAVPLPVIGDVLMSLVLCIEVACMSDERFLVSGFGNGRGLFSLRESRKYLAPTEIPIPAKSGNKLPVLNNDDCFDVSFEAYECSVE